jgi:hypothetical protein
VTGTITLTTGKFVIDNDLTIQGPGAAQLAANGHNTAQVFVIDPGVTVSISGLPIENGSAGTDVG